jgi:hypothetical protein
MSHPIKAGVDIAALGAMLGAYISHDTIVVISALAGAVWYGIQIGEWAYKKYRG